MKYILFVSTILLFVSLSFQVSTEERKLVKSSNTVNQVGNEWIVRLKKGVDVETRELMTAHLNTLRVAGVESVADSDSRFVVVDDASSEDIDTFIDLYYDSIDFIEPNSYVESSYSLGGRSLNIKANEGPDNRHDNYTRDDVEWSIDRIDQIELPLDNKYHYNFTGKDVNVYLVGSAINRNHQELSQTKITDEFSLFGSFIPVDGAATGAASVIAGKNLGVAKDAHIRVINIQEQKGTAKIDSIVRGLEHIYKKGKRPGVVEVSFGSATVNMEQVAYMVDELIDDGFVVLWNSGRNSMDACNHNPVPSIPAAIIVGHTDLSEEEDRDVYGEDANYGDCIDIYAPGHSINGAGIDDNTSYTPYIGFGSVVASGYAAMMLERNEKLHTHDVKSEMIRMSHGLDKIEFDKDSNPRMLYTVGFSSGNALNLSFLLIAFLIMISMLM